MPTIQPIQRSHRGFPEGFQYNDAVLSLDQEQTLVDEFAYLPFREFEFRGMVAGEDYDHPQKITIILSGKFMLCNAKDAIEEIGWRRRVGVRR